VFKMAPLYSRVDVIAPINRLCLPNAMLRLKLIPFPKFTLDPNLLLFLVPTLRVGTRKSNKNYLSTPAGLE